MRSRCARAALAAALLVLGCTAAALALFAMTLHPADARILCCRNCTIPCINFLVAAGCLIIICRPVACELTQGRCAPTDAEAAGLRAASELLLLAALAQVLAAAAALLLPSAPAAAFFAYAVGWLTAYRAMDVVWMLVACHGRVHGALAFHFWFLYAVLLAALLAGCFVATR
ncbi:hypothetical protein SETIT_4G073900v2 [Setaria italica]|uniref:Uncharacterized protein n=1 Tax=Setaria italica TaxID=4555 RepID=A0A368QRR9_SETIT|nr:hypothetical protein SETIT_4G073900v2 [Setaria italica]